MSRSLPRAVVLWIAVAGGAASIIDVPTQPLSASNHSEYEVKAAYLYNFGRFVEWPRDAPSERTSEFSICVLGRDPFGPVLDATISGEKIDGKNVVARRITTVEDADSCRVMFISSSEDKQLKDILSAVGNLSILTVSDLPDFIPQGGIIQFILTTNRVRFEINLAAAQQAGLNLRSELLRVAAQVRGRSQPRE